MGIWRENGGKRKQAKGTTFGEGSVVGGSEVF